VQISLPNGEILRTDSSGADRSLSKYFKRNVVLRHSAPDDFTVDQYHPDLEGADPGGNRDTVVAQKLGSALFASLGMQSPLPVGSFLDVFPVSVLTTSTLARLSQLQPQSRFDPRRFRMNVVLRTEPEGFIENDWIGRTLGMGETTRFSVTLPDPRCVMVTVAQDGLPKDTDVLRALVAHNRLQLGDMGAFPVPGFTGLSPLLAACGSVTMSCSTELPCPAPLGQSAERREVRLKPYSGLAQPNRRQPDMARDGPSHWAM
jgi:hypothetical protein